MLLASNANVNLAGDDGETPLIYAAKQGNKEMVELLLAHNADVNAKSKAGKTAVNVAKNAAVVNVLLQHGAHL